MVGTSTTAALAPVPRPSGARFLLVGLALAVAPPAAHCQRGTITPSTKPETPATGVARGLHWEVHSGDAGCAGQSCIRVPRLVAPCNCGTLTCLRECRARAGILLSAAVACAVPAQATACSWAPCSPSSTASEHHRRTRRAQARAFFWPARSPPPRGARQRDWLAAAGGRRRRRGAA